MVDWKTLTTHPPSHISGEESIRYTYKMHLLSYKNPPPEYRRLHLREGSNGVRFCVCVCVFVCVCVCVCGVLCVDKVGRIMAGVVDSW